MKTTVALFLLTALATPAFSAPAMKAATLKVSAPKAAAAPKAEVGRSLSEHQRSRLAIAEVTRDLKPWVSRSTKVTVRSAIVPFNGDRRNPITGEGPITIFVKQERPVKGVFGRIRAFFNPFARQTYLVNIDNKGQAQILDRMSLAPQRRLKSFFLDKLALGSLLGDFVKSGRMTETIFTALGAGGAAFVNPVLSGALWMRVGQVVTSSIKAQNDVRKSAMAETLAWAKDGGKAGSWPTLMESYREYQANIGAADSGASPISLSRFAEQLSINRL